MRAAAVLLMAVLPLGAQMASRAVPAGVAGGVPQAKAAPVKISVSTLYPIERTCDEKLRAIGEPNTVDMLGATRGVYLDGYGAVFTSEMSLATPPAIYPFHPAVTKEDIVNLHQKKVQRLPLLINAMKEVMRSAAAGLAAVPDSQQIVLAVRLDYMKWEDTSGLPGLIQMKADRKSALAGNIQVEKE